MICLLVFALYRVELSKNGKYIVYISYSILCAAVVQ